MPVFGVVDRFPLPTLKLYVAVSSVLLSSLLYYAYRTVAMDHTWNDQFQLKLDQLGISDATRSWLDESFCARLLYFMMTDQACVWVLVNSGCCILFVIGKLIQLAVLGKLRVIEQQLLRERLWSFLLYKCVFVFGVLNLQYLDEVVLWSMWYAVVGFLFLLSATAHDRYKYVLSTPNGSRTVMANLKVIAMFVCIFLTTCALFLAAAVVSVKVGYSYGLFLGAECMVMFFRCLHGIFRYSLLLRSSGQPELADTKNAFAYYAELVFELSVLMTELLQYAFMLIWSNTLLTVASLVICTQLRFLYCEIDSVLRRHKNHQRVLQFIKDNYPQATHDDLVHNNDNCAICWDMMKSARKLPCGHLFHCGCIRGWLEQDTSCPTCRCTLQVPRNTVQNVASNARNGQDRAGAAAARRRHVFHFDGARYARWLPSFSVQVSHNIGGLESGLIFGTGAAMPPSQVGRMAETIRDMFPQVPLDRILEDLNETRSVEATIENILEQRLFNPNELDEIPDDAESRTLSISSTESEEENDVGGSGSLSSTSLIGGVDSGFFVESAEFADLDFPEASTSSAYLSNDNSMAEPSSSSTTASRFSKSSDEREVILDDQKRSLTEYHRRRYIQSSRGADLRAAGRSLWSGSAAADLNRTFPSGASVTLGNPSTTEVISRTSRMLRNFRY